LTLGLASVLLAALAAVRRRRGRPEAPTQGRVWVPAQLDRADFPEPGRPFLLAVFTSATCASCLEVTERARQWAALVGPELAYAELPAPQHPDLHRRYRIDTVPVVLLADVEGVVRAAFVGRPDWDELEAALRGGPGAHEGRA